MTAPDLAAGDGVAAVRRKLAAVLDAAGIEAAETDARLLLQHALGADRATLLRDPARKLSAGEAECLRALGARRLRREPLAQIVGRREFWSLDLAVTPATLIPRPETETLVETALAHLAAAEVTMRPLRIADGGTGSGAILLALLSELPRAFGVGTDRSDEALCVARTNARRCKLHERSAFVRGDYTAALASGFDLLVSNPPYIRSGDIPALAPEVRDHEPRTALDGGPDGLDAYRALAADAARVLAPGGFVAVEIGAGQHDAVRRLFASADIEPCGAPVPDLAGIPRVLAFRRR